MIEWRAAPGYEGRYEVSSSGDVRSLTRPVWNGSADVTVPGRTKSLYLRPDGYNQVTLSFGNGRKAWLVHRLVALAFLPRQAGKLYVNHLDGNKQNNTPSNLEWCTRQHNVRHAFATGLQRGLPGSKNPAAKLAEHDVLWIKAWLSSGFSNCAIARAFGVSDVSISLIKRGLKWQHVSLEAA